MINLISLPDTSAFRNFENAILETYNKILLLNSYITHINLTLKIATKANLINFSAVALYRQHCLWIADHLNG